MTDIAEDPIETTAPPPKKRTKDDMKAFVEKAKKNNVSDTEIYDYLKGQEDIQSFHKKADEAGTSERDQKRVIGEKLGLDLRQKPNLFQRSLELLAGPIPYLGEVAGIKPVEELKATPGGFLAGAVSAPRSLIDFPTLLSQASMQFHNPEMQQPKSVVDRRVGEFHPEEAYTPPEIEDGKISPYRGIPEEGDIGPLLRAILPSGQQSTEALVAEKSMPETGFGQGAFRAAQFGGGGSIGGPVGAGVGAGLGVIDYGLEQQEYSPEARAVIESLVGLIPTAGKGGSSTARNIPPPPENFLPPSQFKQWTKSILRKTRSNAIDGVSDLAAKVLMRDPENINFQAISDLKGMGFDLNDVPVQAYTKGGMPNWLEGAQENSLWGGKRYKKLMNEFTEGMTQRADAILDTIPIEEIHDAVTHESLGAPVWDNYVHNMLNEQAPNLNLDRPSLGKLGTDSIERFDTTMKSQADALYEQSKFQDTDVLPVDSKGYNSLKDTISNTKKKIAGEGFVGADREAALRVIKDLEELFSSTKKIGVTGKKIGAASRAPIKFEDLRKNLQALNKTISYDTPGVINLLEPISNEIRNFFRSEAPNNPKVQAFVNGNEVFSQRAQLLKDPKIRKFYNMDDEQFYAAMKKPSNLEAFRDFAERSGNQAAYDQLRGGLLIKELRPAFEAQTPGEMARKLTDPLIERMRDIERFYPEYPELANGLHRAREGALQFNTPEEMQRSVIRQNAIEYQLSGETPSKILGYMDSPKGINLVKDTLTTTKQGKSIYDSMARKKLEQVLYGKTKKTEVSLGEISKVFKDVQTDAVVKALLSEQNYNQLKTISRIAESFEEGKNVSPHMKKHFEKLLLVGGAGSLMADFMLGNLSGGTAGTVSLSLLAKGALSKSLRKSIAKQAQGIYKPTP